MPRNIRLVTTSHRGVSGESMAKSTRPMAQMAMPAEATMRGSSRSDSLPVMGENAAISSVWTIKMNPAVSASNPQIFCRYRLSMNATAPTAL